MSLRQLQKRINKLEQRAKAERFGVLTIIECIDFDAVENWETMSPHERDRYRDQLGRWVPAAHQPMLDETLFNLALKARTANWHSYAWRANKHHCRYSLSGLALCGACGAQLQVLLDDED